VAALAGHPGAVATGGAAVLAMAVWLLIYRSVSAPVNRQLTAAAHDGRIPGDARALQRQWDYVVNARAALQTVAGLVSGPRAGSQALKSRTGIRDSPDARPGRAVIVGTRLAPSVPDRGRGNLWLNGENRWAG